MADFHQSGGNQPVERLERRLGQYRHNHNVLAQHFSNSIGSFYDEQRNQSIILKQRYVESKAKKNNKKASDSKKDTFSTAMGTKLLNRSSGPVTEVADSEPVCKKQRLDGSVEDSIGETRKLNSPITNNNNGMHIQKINQPSPDIQEEVKQEEAEQDLASDSLLDDLGDISNFEGMDVMGINIEEFIGDFNFEDIKQEDSNSGLVDFKDDSTENLFNSDLMSGNQNNINATKQSCQSVPSFVNTSTSSSCSTSVTKVAPNAINLNQSDIPAAETLKHMAELHRNQMGCHKASCDGFGFMTNQHEVGNFSGGQNTALFNSSSLDAKKRHSQQCQMGDSYNSVCSYPDTPSLVNSQCISAVNTMSRSRAPYSRESQVIPCSQSSMGISDSFGVPQMPCDVNENKMNADLYFQNNQYLNHGNNQSQSAYGHMQPMMSHSMVRSLNPPSHMSHPPEYCNSQPLMCQQQQSMMGNTSAMAFRGMRANTSALMPGVASNMTSIRGTAGVGHPMRLPMQPSHAPMHGVLQRQGSVGMACGSMPSAQMDWRQAIQSQGMMNMQTPYTSQSHNHGGMMGHQQMMGMQRLVPNSHMMGMSNTVMHNANSASMMANQRMMDHGQRMMAGLPNMGQVRMQMNSSGAGQHMYNVPMNSGMPNVHNSAVQNRGSLSTRSPAGVNASPTNQANLHIDGTSSTHMSGNNVQNASALSQMSSNTNSGSINAMGSHPRSPAALGQVLPKSPAMHIPSGPARPLSNSDQMTSNSFNQNQSGSPQVCSADVNMYKCGTVSQRPASAGSSATRTSQPLTPNNTEFDVGGLFDTGGFATLLD